VVHADLAKEPEHDRRIDRRGSHLDPALAFLSSSIFAALSKKPCRKETLTLLEAVRIQEKGESSIAY
jgi:hypothetical protein